MNSSRYNRLSASWQKKFGAKIQKICIDGGFTCPNRDGTSGQGGCIFCVQPERENKITPQDITRQTKHAIESSQAQKDKNTKFIAYFQNYSATYAPANELSKKYDAALCDDRIVGLAIATRPDCITDEVASLLAEYAKRYYVYVEMGLQTANDTTARLINRGYATSVFTSATEILRKNAIDVVVHLIFGLPNETDEDIARTIDFVNEHDVAGVKIHSLYVTKGARIVQDYLSQAYQPQEFDDYIRRLSYAITHLNKDITIHRITGDCERGKLIAPMWNNRKKLIRNALEKNLEQQNLTQGCHYKTYKT